MNYLKYEMIWYNKRDLKQVFKSFFNCNLNINSYNMYINYNYKNMTYANITDFRTNLSNYLEKVKYEKTILILWKRQKKEFIVLPYIENDNLFKISSSIEEEIIHNEYNSFLENQMNDWLDKENDNLFKIN